jgi:chromosome segregation ATPase
LPPQANAEAARTEAASIEETMRGFQDTKRDDDIATIKDEIKGKAAELKERMVRHPSPLASARTTDSPLSRQNQQRDFTADKKRLDSTIKQYEADLAAERAKLERSTDSERKVILDEIAKLTDQQGKVSIDIARARNEAKEFEDAYRAANDDLQRLKEEIRTAESEASKCQGRISHLRQSKSNPMSNYGQGVPQLERLIQQNQRSWIKQPVGPLGAHVELKDPRYSTVLESFFNQTLNAYVVTNEQDKALMQKLQRQANSCVRFPRS